MARFHLHVDMPEAPDELQARLERESLRSGWVIVKVAPATSYGRPLSLTLKAGPSRSAGCGRTTLVFAKLGVARTRLTIDTRRALSYGRAERVAIGLVTSLNIDPKALGLDPERTAMPGQGERFSVRLSIVIVFAIAVLAALRVSVPEGSQGEPKTPGVAFHSASLFHLEIGLIVFYGGLLVLTPLVAGIFRGRLPTEISTHGAKFPDDINEITEDRVKALEDGTNSVREELALVSADLKKAT
jgi:hypothetical protein